MDNVVDISWVKLALFGLILLVPFFYQCSLQIRDSKRHDNQCYPNDISAHIDWRVFRISFSIKQFTCQYTLACHHATDWCQLNCGKSSLT